MFENLITLRPDKPNFPLDPVWIGQGGDALFIVSEVPEDATECKICYKRTGDTAGTYFDGDLNATTGDWHIYIPPAYTQIVGAGSYQVVAVVGTRNYWCGSGVATVQSSCLGGLVPGADQTVVDQRVRDVSTGLWHRIQLIPDAEEASGFRLVWETEGTPYVS